MKKKNSKIISEVMLLALLLFMVPLAWSAAGASFTSTNSNVDGVGHCKNNDISNCNIYDGKNFVWLNGGPAGAQLGDGEYVFAVLVPSGQNDPNDGTANNLSDTTGAPSSPPTGNGDSYLNRIFRITGGTFSYSGTHELDNEKIRLMPYDDTTNGGGVYILAICRLHPDGDGGYYKVNSSDCKFDAFKVVGGDGGPPECEADCEEGGTLSGMKYYDANTDGAWNSGEPGIANWNITIDDEVITTGSGGTFSKEVDFGSYTVSEVIANAPWVQTGNLFDQTASSLNNIAILSNFNYTVMVDGGDTSGLYFGNICLGAGGGHTLGFWSNKNGKSLFNADDLSLMVALNLKKADGSDFDPADYSAFKAWLLNAKATNMAYMLSAQLAAMELNVLNGMVLGGAFIYAPGTESANTNGFATVSDIMAEANTELGLHGLTTSSSPDSAFRLYQEDLKNALDRANNNQTFVQPGPDSCPTPVFPATEPQ